MEEETWDCHHWAMLQKLGKWCRYSALVFALALRRLYPRKTAIWPSLKVQHSHPSMSLKMLPWAWYLSCIDHYLGPCMKDVFLEWSWLIDRKMTNLFWGTPATWARGSLPELSFPRRTSHSQEWKRCLLKKEPVGPNPNVAKICVILISCCCDQVFMKFADFIKFIPITPRIPITVSNSPYF